MTERDAHPEQSKAEAQAIVGAQAELLIKQPDLKVAAAELRNRLDELKKSLAGIEQAKVVRQHLLDREVSI